MSTACFFDQACSPGNPSCVSCCSALGYWDPLTAVGVGTAGGVTLTVEIEARIFDSDLDMIVCKDFGTFTNDIYLWFEESCNYFGWTMYDNLVWAMGSNCSDWVRLDTSTWQEGDCFGGQGQIVSPDNCFWDYLFNNVCTPAVATPCGICWTYNTSGMTRTCKP
jgi:hypothetical protein